MEMAPRASAKRASVPLEYDGELSKVTRVQPDRRAASTEPQLASLLIQSPIKVRTARGEGISLAMVDPDLSTVQEQSQQQQDQQGLQEQQQQQLEHLASSEETQSHWPQPEDILPEDALFELPLLYYAASSVLSLISRDIVAGNLHHALADPSSLLRKKMRSVQTRIQDHRIALAAPGPYLETEVIENIVFGSNEAALQVSRERDSKLDDIVHKINLSSFVIIILECYLMGSDNGLVHEILETTNNWFPGPFMSHMNSAITQDFSAPQSGSSNLIGATSAMALELRTQCAILKIRRAMEEDAHADPCMILRDIFYQTEPVQIRTRETLEHQRLRSWNVGGWDDFGAQFKQRIAEIDALLPDPADDDFEKRAQELSDADLLTQKYDLGQFCLSCFHWIKERSDELSGSIQRRGGIEIFINSIERLLNNDFKEPAFSQMMAIAQEATLASQPQFQSSAVDHLGSPQTLARHHTQSASAFQSPSVYQTHAVPSVENQGAINHQDLQAFSHMYDARMQQQHQAHVQAHRSMMDTQPNGSKLSFETSLPIAAHGQASKKRKRQVPFDDDDDDEVSDDAGYTQARRPRQEVLPSPLDSATAKQFQTGSSPGNSVDLLSRAAQSSVPQSSCPLTQFQEATATIAESLKLVRSTGKSVSEKRRADARLEDDRKTQSRRKWGETETAALVAYIEELGTSWAQIQKRDQAGPNLLAGRDQVALKDKARNLKFEYLKAGHIAPANFDAVSLSKSMWNKLSAWKMMAADDLPTEHHDVMEQQGGS